MARASLTLTAFLVASCASPSSGPAIPDPTRAVVRVSGFEHAEFWDEKDQNSITVPVSPEEVWRVLPNVYTGLEIPVTLRVPGELVLGNSGLQVRRIAGESMSHYVDCGTSLSGVIANRYDVTVSLQTRIQEGPEGGARVATVLEAWAEPRVTRGDPVRCRSKGTLEKEIGLRLAGELGLGGGLSTEP